MVAEANWRGSESSPRTSRIVGGSEAGFPGVAEGAGTGVVGVVGQLVLCVLHGTQFTVE